MVQEKRKTNETLEWALLFAERGIHVLPTEHGGKRPLTRNGVKDSSTDPSQIWEWFGKGSEANLGIRCGSISGIIVIDIDPRNGGDLELKRLIEENGPLTVEEGPIVITGDNGTHYICRHPGFAVRIKSLGPGVDVIGEDRYANTVSSLGPSGNRYRFPFGYSIRDLPIPRLSEWVIEMLRDNGKRAHRTNLLTDDGFTAGNRNNHLTRYVGQKINQGLKHREIEYLTLIHNEENCLDPLPDDEVLKIVRGCVQRYACPGLSGSSFVPMVYVYELMMMHDLATYKGIVYRYSKELGRYEIWDNLDLRRTIFALSDKTLSPQKTSVVMQYLQFETYREDFSETEGIPEKDFVSERIVRDVLAKVYLKEAYPSYEEWCKDRGLKAVTQTDLRKMIETETGNRVQRLTGGYYGFRGLKLVEE